MDTLTLPTKQQLLQAKYSLYKILEQFDKEDLNDTDSNLLYELSFCPEIESMIVEEKYGKE